MQLRVIPGVQKSRCPCIVAQNVFLVSGLMLVSVEREPACLGASVDKVQPKLTPIVLEVFRESLLNNRDKRRLIVSNLEEEPK